MQHVHPGLVLPCLATLLLPCYPQEKVINSITELYTFMDSSNQTLDLKVMGEGAEDEVEYVADPDSEEARKSSPCSALTPPAAFAALHAPGP